MMIQNMDSQKLKDHRRITQGSGQEVVAVAAEIAAEEAQLFADNVEAVDTMQERVPVPQRLQAVIALLTSIECREIPVDVAGRQDTGRKIAQTFSKLRQRPHRQQAHRLNNYISLNKISQTLH